jgi:hypothetical protein
MKTDIASAIAKFKLSLARARPKAWAILKEQPAAPEERYLQFEAFFGFPLPEDLRIFYKEMNGYWLSEHEEDKQVFPNRYLLSFDDALRHFDNSPFGIEYNRSEWVIISDQSGEIIFRKIAPLDQSDSAIYIRCLEAGLNDWTLYDGIGEMFETYAEFLDSRVFESDDMEQETTIALRHNHHSQYWRHSARILGLDHLLAEGT